MTDFVGVLERLAARHGINVEPGSVRQKQIVAWVREVGPSVPDGALGYLESELERCEAWPKFGEIRDAIRRAKNKLQTVFAGGDSGDVCVVCRGSGWVAFRRRVVADGPLLPWAGACLCAAGARVGFAVAIDRDLFADVVAERRRGDEPESTPERREAALAYIRASFGSDPEPDRMVASILAGRADHVVRTILARPATARGFAGEARSAAPLDATDADFAK